MDNLRALTESARNLISRVTGSDANVPPRQKEAEETLRRVEAQLEALKRRWRGFQEGVQAQMDAARGLRSAVSDFLAQNTLVPAQQFTCVGDALAKWHELSHSLLQAGVAPVFSALQLIAEIEVRKVKERRGRCREALARREALRSKLKALSAQKNFAAASSEANQVQSDLSQAEKTYDVALAEFASSVDALEVEYQSLLLTRMCSFSETLRSLQMEGGAQFEALGGTLAAQRALLERQASASSQELKSGAREADRLRLLQSIDSNVLDPSIMALFARHHEPAPEAPRLPGENVILRAQPVVRLHAGSCVPGTVTLTNFRVLFQPHLRRGTSDAASAAAAAAAAASGSTLVTPTASGEIGTGGSDGDDVRELGLCSVPNCSTSKDIRFGLYCAAHGPRFHVEPAPFSLPLRGISRVLLAADDAAGAAGARDMGGGSGEGEADGDGDEDESAVVMWSKDLQTLSLSFVHCRQPDAAGFLAELARLAWEGDLPFAFAYRPAPLPDPSWALCNENGLRDELTRLGLPNSDWVVSALNQQWAAVPTYPSALVVPAAASVATLEGSIAFRSKGRFPVLCWRPPSSSWLARQGGGARVALLRCSQPLAGMKRARSEADERLLGTVAAAVGRAGKTLVILDCRPKVNALGNIAKGGGWEDVDNYPGAAIEFLDIENIHAIRESFAQLRGSFLLLPPLHAAVGGEGGGDAEPVIGLQRYAEIAAKARAGSSIKWMRHVSAILAGGVRAAWLLSGGGGGGGGGAAPCSVVVHCSDGWDRTAQICALAELLVDPFYRSLKGFAVLVEKEFALFGHQFARRFGHGAERKNYEDSQRSPIFFQFLDAVFQIVSQWPDEFEFNAAMLASLAEHVLSCRFGNFLCDSQKQRAALQIEQRTFSVWGALLQERAAFCNPRFRPTEEPLLRVEWGLEALKLFLPLYARWDPHLSLGTPPGRFAPRPPRGPPPPAPAASESPVDGSSSSSLLPAPPLRHAVVLGRTTQPPPPPPPPPPLPPSQQQPSPSLSPAPARSPPAPAPKAPQRVATSPPTLPSVLPSPPARLLPQAGAAPPPPPPPALPPAPPAPPPQPPAPPAPGPPAGRVAALRAMFR